MLEHPLDIQRLLAGTKRAVGQQARGIVHQRDQINLAHPPLDRHAGTVHHIAIPDITGITRFIAAMFCGLTGGADRPRQPMALQQTVDAGTRDRPAWRLTAVFQQGDQLVDGAARVVPLGVQDRRLNRCGQFGLPPVRTDLGGQCLNPVASPGIVPSLNRLLANAVAVATRDIVVTLGQFPEQAFEFAMPQMLTADQGAEHRESEQGHGV